jgi:hypothetical protein
MFSNQLFEPDPMEKELSPWDIYKDVNKDSKIHDFELVVAHHQL